MPKKVKQMYQLEYNFKNCKIVCILKKVVIYKESINKREQRVIKVAQNINKL